MRRLALAAAAALALPAGLTTAASAHQGNPNFRSTITAVTPVTPGVSLDILSLDDRIELTNHSNVTVVVQGYNGEPYLRVLPDGSVQVNQKSPAGYLNSERFAAVRAPKTADPHAPPVWKLIDKSGRYEWHDHRIHYMARGTPPQVKDESKRTKIFDWAIPLRAGSTTGAIKGELFWVPKDNSGPPLGAIVGFVALLVAGAGAVVVTRRRRVDEGAVREAW